MILYTGLGFSSQPEDPKKTNTQEDLLLSETFLQLATVRTSHYTFMRV